MPREESLTRYPEPLEDGPLGRLPPGLSLPLGLVAFSIVEPGHGITIAGDIGGIGIGEPVDHDGIIGNVPLVETEATDVLSTTPLGQMTHSL